MDGVSEEDYEEFEEEEEEGEESLIKSSGDGSSDKARLVSVALDGTVTEWDLNQLKPLSACGSRRERVDLGLRERTDGGGETRTTAAISHRVRRRVREVGDFHGEECRWRWLEA